MSTRLDALARLALSETSTELGIQAKASALVKLVAAGEASPVPAERLRTELQHVASTEAVSARGLQGVLAALRQLEHLDTPAGVWPSTTPDEPAGPDYWPYCCSPARHGQETMRELDAASGTHGSRDRWRQALEDAPPWKHAPG